VTGSGRDSVLWVVEGMVHTDSTGGPETWIYLTGDDVLLPDVGKPFGEGRAHWREWDEIYVVRVITEAERQAYDAEGVLLAVTADDTCALCHQPRHDVRHRIEGMQAGIGFHAFRERP